jgi:CRP-like cAMP-binding protein
MQFLERLDDEARRLVLAVARPVSYAKGARLVRQSETARGAYVLGSGSAEAMVVLPGGERLSVATLGAGAVFGETSLLERNTCTATVSARENIEGWFIERDDFRALVAQRAPAALRVQHAVTLALADKLRALNARVLEVPAPGDRMSRTTPDDLDPLAGVERLKKASFDYRPFLPLLPLFDGFEEEEIAEVLSAASCLELPAGHKVFVAGQPSRACFAVVRGAVDIRARHAKRERRMALLGPGQLLGYMSALEHGAHGSDAAVREQALLLEIARGAFDSLYHGTSPASTKLRRVIQRSLLASLDQTNRHLTRLISLARLRGDAEEGNALERALGGQIVASPDRAA